MASSVLNLAIANKNSCLSPMEICAPVPSDKISYILKSKQQHNLEEVGSWHH